MLNQLIFVILPFSLLMVDLLHINKFCILTGIYFKRLKMEVSNVNKHINLA